MKNKKRISFFVPPELADKIDDLAVIEKRSRPQICQLLLEAGFECYQPRPPLTTRRVKAPTPP